MKSTNFKVTNSDFGDLFIYKELFNQGNLWRTGVNSYGAGGTNFSSGSSPVLVLNQKWLKVSSSGDTVGAIKPDGTLWMWGRSDDYGQLGDETMVNKSSPVQTVAGGTNWFQVSVSDRASGAIKTDGTLWMWGINTNLVPMMGDNTNINKSSPVQTVAGGTNWKQLSVGYDSVGAIKTDGTLWVWGSNSSGKLGDNSTIAKSSPVQTAAGGTNWKQVSIGQSISGAIKTDGTLWTWGGNIIGAIGDNTRIDRSSPVQTVAAGNNWKVVSAGSTHMAAIKTDGTLWLWGSGDRGVLGDNTIASKSSPVQTISGGTNWKTISAGNLRNFTLKNDGTWWTWGWNYNGQLGDNTSVDKSSPIQTVAGGTDWISVMTAATSFPNSSMALKYSD